MNPRVRWYPKELSFLGNFTEKSVNQLVEKEILECDRSAFIGPSSEVGVYYEYLKRQ